MIEEIIKKLYKYERENRKLPSLIIVGEPEYHQLEVERYSKNKNIFLYSSGGVFIESIMGVRLLKDKSFGGVYFAEEQVLK